MLITYMKSRRLACVIAVIYMLVAYVSATYFTYSDVTELTAGNFDNYVINADGVALVHFYAPWNSLCKTLSSKINSVAANLKGIALVGAVDCTNKETAGSLCQRYDIRGFPTLKLFGPDRTKNPYTGEYLKQPTDYAGDRTSKDLVDAVSRMLTDVYIRRVKTAEDLGEMRQEAAAAGKAQVLLFTDKELVTSLYKGLSMQLRNRGLLFGQVHSSAQQVVAEFGVKTFPKLLVVKLDGEVETYVGDIKAPAIREFLLGFATNADVTEAQGSANSDGDSSSKTPDAAWSFVRQVDGLDELPALLSREDMALLTVHGADGEDGCRDTRQAFLTAAGEMQPVVDTFLVSVAAADMAPESSGAVALSRIGVDVSELAAKPCELQVVLLPFGSSKFEEDSVVQLKYSGPPDGKELQRWVTSEVPNLVTELNDEGASEFLMVDPSQGQIGAAPKVLLFTNKDEAPGVFRALAMALRGRGNMDFAWVQANSPASRSIVESFKPPRVPSMLIVLPHLTADKANPGQKQVQFAMQPYSGPLKYALMRDFLVDVANEVERVSGVVQDPATIRRWLPEITSQQDFESSCVEPAGMCLIGLLDGTAPGLKDELRGLLAAAMQQTQGSSALHFAWIDARKHKSVLKAFGIMLSDVPVLVALSARRMRFALLHSSSDEESGKGPRLRPNLVAQMVGDVLSAKIKTEPLQALPEIREGDDSDSESTGTNGAEAAAAVEPVEEEFDLSDIMSEEVEGGAVGGTKADRLQEIEEQLKAEEEARKAAEKAAKSSSKKKKKSKKSKSRTVDREEL